MTTIAAKKPVTLTLNYRTPSLNVSLRQHWVAQYKEKQKAYDALLSALLATASDPLTRIISPDQSSICSMGYATLKSYLEMNRGGSGSKRSKSKSRTSIKKKQ